MITGIHSIMYSKNADAIRAFFRDVLHQPSVDAGHGWLIFAAPPSEIAMHPTEDADKCELYLMCDNLDATLADLKAKGVECGPTSEQRWGRVATLRIAPGTDLGIYEPKHPVAAGMTSASPAER